MILFGALISVIFMLLVGWSPSEPLAALLGADEDAVGLTSMYIAVLLTFAPCFTLNNILVAFVRNDEGPRLAMAAIADGSWQMWCWTMCLCIPWIWGCLSRHWLRESHHGQFAGAAVRPYPAPQKQFSPAPLPAVFQNCGKMLRFGVLAFIGEVSSCIVILVFNMRHFRPGGEPGRGSLWHCGKHSLCGHQHFQRCDKDDQPLISDYYARGIDRQEHQVIRYGIDYCCGAGRRGLVGRDGVCSRRIAEFSMVHDPRADNSGNPGLRIYFVGFWLAGVNLMLAASFAAVDDPGRLLSYPSAAAWWAWWRWCWCWAWG